MWTYEITALAVSVAILQTGCTRGQTAIEAAAAETALRDAHPLSQNAYKIDVAKVAVKRAILRAAGIATT